MATSSCDRTIITEPGACLDNKNKNKTKTHKQQWPPHPATEPSSPTPGACLDNKTNTTRTTTQTAMATSCCDRTIITDTWGMFGKQEKKTPHTHKQQWPPHPVTEPSSLTPGACLDNKNKHNKHNNTNSNNTDSWGMLGKQHLMCGYNTFNNND